MTVLSSTTWQVKLDPPGAIASRTQLDLNSGDIQVDQKGIDWGDGAIAAFMADVVIGSVAVGYRIPNRVIHIPLMLGAGSAATIAAEEAARAKLQQKVALFQREGGALLRQRSGGVAMYADVVNATLTLPDVYGETGGVEPNVILQLECIPDFYGDEISLDAINGTGRINSVLQLASAQAAIVGDHPGRCRIVISETSGNDQKGALWGFRSRHYDAASTSALFLEAEAMTPLDAAATHVLAGASGGSTMRHNNLPGGSWCPVLLTDLLAGSAALTQTGSYEIWARCYSATATPSLRLVWGVGDVAHPITNTPVQLPGQAGFYIVDLGQVRLDAPPTGNYKWHGVIQALAAVQGDPIEIDCLYFQPLDEPAGELQAVQGIPPSVSSIGNPTLTGANDATIGTVAWTQPGANDKPTPTGTQTQVILPGSSISQYWKATGLGFAIPSIATIVGIRVVISRQNVSGSGWAFDNRVSLVKAAGGIQATNKAIPGLWVSVPGGGYGLGTYGAASPTSLSQDLWGTTWTPAEINAAGFGFVIAAQTGAGGGSSISYIGAPVVTVFFTAGGFSASADAVCYSSRTAELRTEGMYRQDAAGVVEGSIAVVVGDLPRIPPSGLEGRAVELFVKPSRGDIGQSSLAVPDSALDTFTAQVKYRPSWLFRP